jgi:hypothetical protein
MPKTQTIPVSPTVADVFTQFLKKLKDEGIADDEITDRLRAMLEQQQLDPEHLRTALFGADTKEP